MEAKELIVRSLEQSQRYLTKALDGLTQEEVAWSPSPECNSIAFILWHNVRVEDRSVNGSIQGKTEQYEAEGWQGKLGTPTQETGGRYTLEQLQAWPVPKLETLRGYANSVREKTPSFIKSVTAKNYLRCLTLGLHFIYSNIFTAGSAPISGSIPKEIELSETDSSEL